MELNLQIAIISALLLNTALTLILVGVTSSLTARKRKKYFETKFAGMHIDFGATQEKILTILDNIEKKHASHFVQNTKQLQDIKTTTNATCSALDMLASQQASRHKSVMDMIKTPVIKHEDIKPIPEAEVVESLHEEVPEELMSGSIEYYDDIIADDFTINAMDILDNKVYVTLRRINSRKPNIKLSDITKDDFLSLRHVGEKTWSKWVDFKKKHNVLV